MIEIKLLMIVSNVKIIAKLVLIMFNVYLVMKVITEF